MKSKKTKVLSLNIECGCSPTVRIVFDESDDFIKPGMQKLLARTIEKRIAQAIESIGGNVEYVLTKRKIRVSAHPETDLIAKSEAQRKEERERRFDRVMKKFRKIHADTPTLEERMKDNPDNGKRGWWGVYGMRHSFAVQADSAQSAFEKVKDEVDSVMLCDVRFLGENPEVIEMV